MTRHCGASSFKHLDARRTQDSPVMPDVWLRYIRTAERMAWARIDPEHPTPTEPPLDLLLTPWSGVRPGEIAKWLRGRLNENISQAGGGAWPAFARIASSDSRVVVCANFDMLI